MAFLDDKERSVIKYMLSCKKHEQFMANVIANKTGVDYNYALLILKQLESIDFLYLYERHAGLPVYKINYNFFEDMRKLLSVFSSYGCDTDNVRCMLSELKMLGWSEDEHREC